jgi:hypothetical protein
MLRIISVESARNELTMNFDATLTPTSNPVAIPANGIVARRTISNLQVTEFWLIQRSTSYKEHNSQDISFSTTTKIMRTEKVRIDQMMRSMRLMRTATGRMLYIITKEVSRVSYPFDCFQLRRNTHKKVAIKKNASKAGVATIAFVENQTIGEYKNNEG